MLPEDTRDLVRDCTLRDLRLELLRNNRLSTLLREEKSLLNNAISRLNPRERKIVELRYGLTNEDGEEMTQKEVADLLGISQSYISRLEKKIMKRLKKEIVRFE